ncbi:MAG: rhamnan synthesis F family protein [Methylocella sp.]
MDVRRFYSYYSNFFDIKARRERYILKHFLDKQFYLSHYPEISKSGLDPIEHYRTKGWREGLNPHPDFDTLYYRGSNPDVEKAGENPFVHFILHGREEGRTSRAVDERDRELALDYLAIAPEFDCKYYLLRNPDVANAQMDPVKHFIQSGWTESRNPRADFNTGYYYFANKDVIPCGVNPFRHYIETGRDKGCAADNQSGYEPHLRLMYNSGLTCALNAVPSLRPVGENDYCMEVPFEVQLASPPFRRVAAIIHVYYTELLSAILNHLHNIPIQTDLFISTDTEAKKAVVLDILSVRLERY